ncbi:hypothetical protein XHC_3857 [Xanthomonas hortorum pv. carotae str. M081]|nr:hypothetical protein XHC_3857 [Xanthomonas hortorum pv. carotae str. M081]
MSAPVMVSTTPGERDDLFAGIGALRARRCLARNRGFARYA